MRVQEGRHPEAGREDRRLALLVTDTLIGYLCSSYILTGEPADGGTGDCYATPEEAGAAAALWAEELGLDASCFEVVEAWICCPDEQERMKAALILATSEEEEEEEREASESEERLAESSESGPAAVGFAISAEEIVFSTDSIVAEEETVSGEGDVADRPELEA